MATAMFAEMLNKSQHKMRLIPESRSYTLNSNRKNRRTSINVLDGIQTRDSRSRSACDRVRPFEAGIFKFLLTFEALE
jgi:hypothetical protein